MATSNFTISSGQTFEISTTTAEVVAKENLKSFDFSQSGGGGYVSQHGGYVAAPQLHVQENRTDRFWLRDAGGNEFNVDLTNIDLPVRDGHVLRQFFVKTDGLDQTRRVGIQNENTGQFVDLSSYALALVQDHKNWKTSFFIKLCLLAFGCLVGAYIFCKYFADPRMVRPQEDPHFHCQVSLGPVPMKTKAMTMAQYRSIMETVTKENRAKYAACRRDLADKEKLQYEADVKSKGQAFVTVREFQRKNFPDLTAALGTWSVGLLVFTLLMIVLSRSAYREKLRAETKGTLRKILFG